MFLEKVKPVSLLLCIRAMDNTTLFFFAIRKGNVSPETRCERITHLLYSYRSDKQFYGGSASEGRSNRVNAQPKLVIPQSAIFVPMFCLQKFRSQDSVK